MNQKDKANTLREKLLQVLNKGRIDYEAILELSSQLVRLDPEFVRFSVDAAHISKLGRELVGRQETAVSELVKNAYDADARVVELIFEDSDIPGGRLSILDDGHGMTRDELINGFMRISTTDKIHNPVSRWYKRQRAGRKGIGRFASQRLGNSLMLATKTADTPGALRIDIDWDIFVPDKEISEIRSKIETASFSKDHGTLLRIQNLRDAWTEAQIRKVYRYISDLIQPFPLSKELKAKKNDPGFAVTFYKQIGNELYIIADEETMIFDHALAVIDGQVDGHGRGSWSVLSDRYDIKEKDMPIGPDRERPELAYKHLRNVNFKAYYFIYLSDLIPGQQLRRISDLAQTRGGIRLYRNGFRVLPYGEPYDDWLRLDASTRAREILPPHANNNFFGFVEIYDPKGKLFEETSSREGLIENAPLRELVEFVHQSLKAAVLRIASIREKKQTASQPDWKPKIKPLESLRDVAKKLKTKEGAGSKEGYGGEEFAEKLESIADEQERIEKEYLQELAMLRVLASLGLAIGQFTHEIRHYNTALRADWNSISRLLSGSAKVESIVGRMDANLKTLKSYTAYFDKTVADNVSRELVPIEIRDVINNFLKATKGIAHRSDIEFVEPEIRGYDLYTRPMHPSEWSSILFNLFTNTQKAIKRGHIEKGKILICAGRENGLVYLEFADNGVGISPDIEDRIFDAFFTTTIPAGSLVDEIEEIIGTGLGLKIVKDIVESASGSIELVVPPEGYETCFRIEIPEAKEEEILDD
ncbi:MAG: sensor histidine kinase [Thermodesulfovibrionales bacterium]|jgi:signal transduction histidine kinase